MKKLLLTLILSVGSLQTLCADQIDSTEKTTLEPNIFGSFSYVTIGMGPPLMLNIGVGNRHIFGNRGALDFSVSYSTFIYINSLQGSVSLLRYLKQQPSSQYYLGLGGSLGISAIYSLGVYGYMTPILTFGKEFFNSSNCKRFFQIDILFPHLFLGHFKTIWFPCPILKYGIEF